MKYDRLTVARSILCIAALVLANDPLSAKQLHITPNSDLRTILKDVQAGDTIELADGLWQGVDLRFDNLPGSADAPIEIRAQTPGKVVLSGKSTFALSGQYVVVAGLVIRNPQDRSDVMQLRTHSARHAHHCRITNCTFQEAADSSAGRESRWLSVYGTHNRVDHCYFEGKKNQGTTLVIWVSQEPQHHLIDHNYFAARPPLDRNGGETIRIGTSETCHWDSASVVEQNYFHACDGEVEIISNKSCANIYRNNLFDACSGALTLRHGNRCLVQHNAFLGREKKGTGGVRIIGTGHTVADNYFEGLRGDALAALSLMNGIQNSPASGYAPVQDAKVTNNTFVDCKVSVEIGVGAGPRQTVPPARCSFTNNRFLPGKWTIFRVHATPADFTWTNNMRQSGPVRGPEFIELPQVDLSLHRQADGLLHRDPSEGNTTWPDQSNTGPETYSPNK